MVSLTSAAPLHVGPRGRDSVHVDCKELSTGAGKKTTQDPRVYWCPHLSLLMVSTCKWASVADSQRLRVSLPRNGSL